MDGTDLLIISWIYTQFFLDSRAPGRIKLQAQEEVSYLGVIEGMTSLGAHRDEYLIVNRELFKKSLTKLLNCYDAVDAFRFFILVNLAYEEAISGTTNKDIIFYHAHNPDDNAKLNFLEMAPNVQWITIVRDPLQSCESRI